MSRLQPNEPDPDNRSSGNTSDCRETARYIEELCAELSGMARRCDLSILSYLLDLARAEAGLTARHGESSSGAIKKRG